MTLTLLFVLMAGLFAGGLGGWLLLRRFYVPKHELAQRLSREQVDEGYVTREMYDSTLFTLHQRDQDLKTKETEIRTLLARVAAADKEKEQLSQMGEQLKQIHESNRQEFSNLANDILRQKSRDFLETNKLSLDHLLAPLQSDIGQFRKTIEATRKEDIQDLTSLKKEIESLQQLNIRLSEDAQRLASALKSDVKVQGNWGEDRLRLILESEGLQKYIDYTSEEVHRDREEARNYRPDFILKLPDGKHLIIDSKVSLNSYVAYFNTQDPEEKKLHIKQLVRSINEHIDELGARNYQRLGTLKSPDFVFMFMHFEPALTLALNESPEIFNRALSKKVVLITPSTLVATFKIVRQLWQHENRARNVDEIFRQCGLLYDKFILFLEEMQGMGEHINKAGMAYTEAMNRLKEGKRKGDTIIGKLEQIRDLDAKTTKSLPRDIANDMDIRFPDDGLKAIPGNG
ncbi:DNA recombination protein RmuC [Chitinophaga deserti]|uniref:DNA recombination protein RmuC n=1 Tax=Chitinophaga deserti TaxID=2164099 RepID=UPI000D6C9171|nr:DNA recombination protein RmuC [Chitinophaga deserti]